MNDAGAHESIYRAKQKSRALNSLLLMLILIVALSYEAAQLCRPCCRDAYSMMDYKAPKAGV